MLRVPRSVIVGAAIGIVASVGMGVYIAVASDDEPVDHVDLNGEALPAGDPFPDGELTTLDGEPVSIEDYAGVPVVVNLWATSCKPCRDEMPALNEVARERSGDVLFLGINTGEEVGVARDFLEEVEVSYDIARDPRGDVLAGIGTPGLPTTVFVSAEGRVLDVHVTEMDADQIRDFIDKNL